MTITEHATKRAMRRLETTCRRRIQQLDDAIRLGNQPDVRALCDAIGALRGRPIYLEALPLSGPHTGVWIADAAADHIYFARDASIPYQEHIILHELAHMLRHHRPIESESELLQREWFPLLDPDRIRALLARSRYDDADEREAELLASLLAQQWRHARPQRGTADMDWEPTPAVRWLREQAGELGEPS